MLSEVNLYLGISGGADAPKSEVIGGYGAVYSVGNNAVFFARGNIMDWRLLPRGAPKERRMQTANDILKLGQYVENPKVLCSIIQEIYGLPAPELLRVLSKNLNLYEPVLISLRRLFYDWVDIIEYALASLYEAENIKAPVDLKKIEPGVDRTLNAKLKKYKHLGFCPCEPSKRIINLFSFPLDAVIARVKKHDPTFMLGVELSEIRTQIAEHVREIEPSPPPEIKKRKPIPRGASVDDCVEYFLDLYRVAMPALLIQEKKNIKLAKQLGKICFVLEHILRSATQPK